MDFEPLKLHPRRDAMELLAEYQKNGVFTNVSREFFKQLQDLSFKQLQDLSVYITLFLFPKWRTGIVIISTVVSTHLDVDEVLLIGRILSHRRQKSRDVLFESTGKPLDEELIDSLHGAEQLTGVKITSKEEDMLTNIYFLTELEDNRLTEREKLGLLTHSITFKILPETDLVELAKARIPMGNGQELYVQQYNGGFISERRTSEHTHKNIFEMLVVLMILRALNTHVMTDAVASASEAASINTIEHLLTDIAALSLLLSPSAISSGYRFDSQILPAFLAATGLDKTRDNLENMLRLFEDIQDRKVNRRRNILVIFLSAFAVFVALLPYTVSFIQRFLTGS